MFDSSKCMKGRWIICLVIMWLASRVGHKDNQDDWSPPITYFQEVASHNLGIDNLPVGDYDTELLQPLIVIGQNSLHQWLIRIDHNIFQMHGMVKSPTIKDPTTLFCFWIWIIMV
jgi:hypothetical protein